MTRTLVLTNHKGGIGKSTSATNIAFGLVNILRSAGAPNPRVLLVDTDSQGHATLVTTGSKDYGMHDSLYTVLTTDRKDAPRVLTEVIKPSNWDDDLHILPASPLLESAERELIDVAGAPYRLADPLGKIAHQYAAIGEGTPRRTGRRAEPSRTTSAGGGRRPASGTGTVAVPAAVAR